MSKSTINEIDVIDNETTHHFNSGVYAREMHVPKEFAATTHSHNFSHMSILASGEVLVDANGTITKYTAPTVISMAAGVHHGIYAITEAVWFCIHPSGEALTPEEIDEITIEKSSYAYFESGGEWEKKILCACGK